MKTIKIKSIKNFGYLIISVALLSFFSCQGQNKNKETDKSDESITETKVNAPSIDIHGAAFFGNLDAVKHHIKAGTDLNQKDPYGSTPLVIAATFGKTEIAKALIDGGADLHIKNNEGSTPLHIAALFCRTEIVKALLKNGADKTLINNYGSTPLAIVSSSFKEIKPVYDQLSKDLGILGLKLDYKHLETTRPIIADLLK